MTLRIGSDHGHCGLRIGDFELNRGTIRNPQSEIRNLQSGFTFIELVFVTLVLGILLVAALPSIQRGWSTLQMERTTFVLAQTLRTARTLAITQGRPIDWIWDAQAREVRLSSQPATGEPVAVPGRLGAPRVIPAAIELAVLQRGQPVERISFFPDGTSQSTSLLIGGTSAPRYQIALNGSTSQVVVR